MIPGHMESEESLFLAPEVQRILVKVYKGDIVEFKASIIQNETICYRDLEEAARVDSIWAKQILDFLANEGILVKEPSELFFACTTCGSKDLALRMRCPGCKGEAFKVGAALEHQSCGYADLEDEFVSSEGFRCPNCKKSLRELGSDYRRFSFFYRCLNCRRLSGVVDDAFLCNKCGARMALEEARRGMLSTYRYNPDSRAKVERRLWGVYRIGQRLAGLHYSSEFGGTVVGKSGIAHSFDLLAWPGDPAQKAGRPSIVVDVLHGGAGMLEGQIAASIAKAIDVGIPNSFAVVVPQASPEWTKKASSCGLTILECPSVLDLESRLEPAVMRAIISTPSGSDAQGPSAGVVQPTRVEGEDAVILSAIREKQDELDRLIRWFIVKSDLLEGQSPGSRPAPRELSR